MVLIYGNRNNISHTGIVNFNIQTKKYLLMGSTFPYTTCRQIRFLIFKIVLDFYRTLVRFDHAIFLEENDERFEILPLIILFNHCIRVILRRLI